MTPTTTTMDAETRGKMNTMLKAVRQAHISANGQLWVRGTGFGETPDELNAAMERAEALLARHGWVRDTSAEIFRDGYDWGQSLKKAR